MLDSDLVKTQKLIYGLTYYGNVMLTPIILQDYLMLILTIPLVYQSLQMDLYIVYNIPMSHPTLHMHAQYEIKGTYLATLMKGMFISLPSTLDVKLCLMTNRHLCMFDKALYPVESINWCVYTLFINDYNRTRRGCLLKTLARTTNLAYSLDGYLWAIRVLAAEQLQIRCVMETHIITIKPPLQIVNVGNGCEASSANIYMPAKSELTTTLQSITRSQFFLDFNFKYTKVSNFLALYNFKFAKWTETEIKTLKAKMLQLPMSMGMFDNIIDNIDKDYPVSLCPKIILTLLVVVGICVIALGIILIWYKRKATLSSSTIGNLVKLVPSLAGNTPSLDSLLPMLSELASSRTKSQTTPTAASHWAAADKVTFLTAPILKPRLQVTPSSPSTSTAQPSAKLIGGPTNRAHRSKYTSEGDTTETVSREMFNKAATDLESKGVINLQKYTKYLAKKDLEPV